MKIFHAIAITILVGMLAFAVAGNSSSSTDTSKPHCEKSHGDVKKCEKFACPMKCEGDKTYDQAGKCPKCGMDLKATECPRKSEAKSCDKSKACTGKPDCSCAKCKK